MSEDQLREEVFYLGYHLHWSYGEIMSLDTSARREFLRLLSDAIERQNASAGRGSR